MPLVRYVALAALVVWLGGTMQALGVDLVRHFVTLAYACGGLIVVALLVMKFVGPPPRGVFIRLALVVGMLGVTSVAMLRGQSRSTAVATIALGAGLLTWYARE